MTLEISHEDPEVLTEAAIAEAEVGDRSLAALDLSSDNGKSKNIVLSPYNFVGSLFRRPSSEVTRDTFDRNNNLLLKRGYMSSVPIYGGGAGPRRSWSRYLARYHLRRPAS